MTYVKFNHLYNIQLLDKFLLKKNYDRIIDIDMLKDQFFLS